MRTMWVLLFYTSSLLQNKGIQSTLLRIANDPVYNMPVSEEGAHHLATLTNLKSLVLFSTTLPTGGKQRLQKALPGTRIIYTPNPNVIELE